MNQQGGTEHLVLWVFNSTLSLNSENALHNKIITLPPPTDIHTANEETETEGEVTWPRPHTHM